MTSRHWCPLPNVRRKLFHHLISFIRLNLIVICIPGIPYAHINDTRTLSRTPEIFMKNELIWENLGYTEKRYVCLSVGWSNAHWDSGVNKLYHPLFPNKSNNESYILPVATFAVSTISSPSMWVVKNLKIFLGIKSVLRVSKFSVHKFSQIKWNTKHQGCQMNYAMNICSS